MTVNTTRSVILRPPDPTLFIHAGTSGLRHLFPIHLNHTVINEDLLSRSISQLRSRTGTTELCTNVDMIRNICQSIRTLEHFDISQNELNNLPADICSLIYLQTLNCSHNQLIDIPNLFEALNQLKEMNISFNQFKHLPVVIHTFKYLKRLYCEHNFIKHIDLDLINLENLKVLVLDHNQIKSFDSIDFSQMKRLECVHIAHNQLTKFPLNLHKLKYLKDVNLSHNRIKSFPIDLLLINSLDVLNLSHNALTQLPPLSDVYKRTSLIFSIDFSFNQLSKFSDYLLFLSLNVDLSNNKIRLISNDLIRKLDRDMFKNRELKISHNPLIQPRIPLEILNEETTNAKHMLEIIRYYYKEQKIDETVRQGFKINITGSKKSGKTSLAYCLEGYMPSIDDEKQERIVHSK